MHANKVSIRPCASVVLKLKKKKKKMFLPQSNLNAPYFCIAYAHQLLYIPNAITALDYKIKFQKIIAYNLQIMVI